MNTLVRDVRSALRRLSAQRAFAVSALLPLALGIGANTAMFSVVNGLLLRPLPFPAADRIVRVGETFGARGGMLTNRSLPLLQDAESFDHLAGFREISLEWAGPNGAVDLSGATVSPALFPLLQATPQLGRLFTDEEAHEGADGVVALSHRAWVNHFASDPDVVGRLIDLSGEPHAVVGVLPEGFYFPSPDSEIWTPFVVPPYTPPTLAAGQARMVLMTAFDAIARLAPDASPEQAEAEASTLLQGAAFRIVSTDGAASGVQVVPLLEEMVGEYRPALLALTAATILVLLIACTNVAGLLLARGVSRQRSLALSAALGASRWRLVRQLMTESLVLSALAGGLGLGIAVIVLRTVPAFVPGDIARLDEVGIDGVALVFALGLSITAGLLFGTAPALQWSRLDLARTLNEGSLQSTAGFRLLRSNRARAALAVGQVALALVLLVGAGLLLASFLRLITVDRGYDPANVLTAVVSNPNAALRPDMTPESLAGLQADGRRFQEALADGVEQRLPALSDVAAVGVSSRLPLGPAGGSATAFRVPGAETTADPQDLPRAAVNFVSPGYFDAMRLRLLSGRTFTGLDRAGTPPVLVVNETLARELFDGDPAVGRQVLPLGAYGETWEVVGVVADVNYEGLSIAGAQSEAYMPLHQREQAGLMGGVTFNSTVTMRTVGDPAAAVPFLREAVAAASPIASIDNMMTMDARLSATVAQPRFYAVLVGGFAALALFLAAFGIYALLSYTVSQRQREIGLRMALGAQRGDVLLLVVRQGAVLVAAGVVLGVIAAGGAVRLLESLLFGVAADNLLALITAPLVLVAVALVACWLPARRATSVDPISALRFE